MTVFVLVCLCLISNALSLLREDVFPTELDECYSQSTIYSAANNYNVQSKCLQKYVYSMFGTRYFDILDDNAWTWIESISIKTHQLVKRQVRNRRRRKEIRTLTTTERQRCFAAINALKRDRVSLFI